MEAALKRPADEFKEDDEATVDEELAPAEPAEDVSHAGGAVVASVALFEANGEEDALPELDDCSHAGGFVVAPRPLPTVPREDPAELGPDSHDEVPTLLAAEVKKLPLVPTLAPARSGFLLSHPGTSPDAAAAKVVFPKVGALDAAASAPACHFCVAAPLSAPSVVGRCFFGLGPPSTTASPAASSSLIATALTSPF